MRAVTRLRIRNFAHIAEATITFGDLTVLVGAQGTGKSLVLQWLKAALDGRQITSALRDAGQDVSKPEALIELIFGVGMGQAWRPDTSVFFDRKEIHPSTLSKLGSGIESVFFIPAHRALLISDGWALPFHKLKEMPVVARLFSQNLFDRFSAREGVQLGFVLEGQYGDLIDDAVYHGGKISLEQDREHAKRLKMTHGPSQLSFMTWTAGQREFTPLLLGLSHLLPTRGRIKRSDIEWVVIEEPEMGLHPKAITVFMLLVLDLLSLGYRVVLSTHSPIVLAVVWMLRRLRETGARWQLVCEAFGVEPRGRASLKKVAEAALQKDVRTYLLAFGGGHTVSSKEISSLDPGAEDDDIAGWGGLTGFGSRFGDVVRQAVNEVEARR